MPNELNNILTLDSDSNIETQQSKEDLIWHEITNAYRTPPDSYGNPWWY
ncbi:MAG: hypothetical protein ACLT5U_14105 [Mediterraneibacter gnavus]